MLDEKTSVTADYHLDESSCSSDSEMDECASEVTQAELEAKGMEFQAKLKAAHKVHGGIPTVNYKEPTATLACNHQEPIAQPATKQEIEKDQAVAFPRGVVVNTLSADMQLGMTSTVYSKEPTATLACNHQEPTAQPAKEQEIEKDQAVAFPRGVVVNTLSADMQLGMTSTDYFKQPANMSSSSSESDEEDEQPPPSPWQVAYHAFDKIVMEYKTKLTADLVAKQQECVDTIVGSNKYLAHHVADKYMDLTLQFTTKQNELVAQQKAIEQELKENKALMVSRDALIVKLHNDASERDALIAKLHNDIAERDGLFVKLHLQNEAKEPDTSVVFRQKQPAVVKKRKCEKDKSGHYNKRGKDKA